MSRVAALATALAFASCAPGQSVLLINVLGDLSGVIKVGVDVNWNAMTAKPIDPVAIGGKATTFSLVFPSTVSGPVSVTVKALDAANVAFDQRSWSDNVQPGQSYTFNAKFGGGGGDGGMGPPDLAAGGDLAGADLASACGKGPEKFTVVPENATAFDAVHGTAPNNLFAVGASETILHSSDGGGKVWGQQHVNMSGAHLRAVWACTSIEVWAAGTVGALFHSTDGKAWAAFASGTGVDLEGLGGASCAEVWAVGGVNVFRYDGNAWTLHKQVIAPVHHVWAVDASDVYLVGDSGTILHRNVAGTDWDQQISGTNERLNGVWGSSGTDLYAVGTNGTILHSPGDGTWAALPSCTTATLTSVFGDGPDTVFAVGGGGTVLVRHAGGAWQPADSSTQLDLASVYAASGVAVAAGVNAILHNP